MTGIMRKAAVKTTDPEKVAFMMKSLTPDIVTETTSSPTMTKAWLAAARFKNSKNSTGPLLEKQLSVADFAALYAYLFLL